MAVLIRKNAGVGSDAIPEQLLKDVIADNNTFWGAAVVLTKPEKDDWPMATAHFKESPDLAKVKEKIDMFKDDLMLLVFEDCAKDSHADDRQPFLLQGDEDSPRYVGGLDGDYSQFAQPESAHSEEFFAVKTYLIPKLQEIHDSCNGKVEAMNEKLRGSLIARDFANLSNTRGTLAIVDLNGNVMLFGNNNPDFKEYDWGWASYSYEPQEQEEQPDDKKEEELPVPSKTVMQRAKDKLAGILDRPIVASTEPVKPAAPAPVPNNITKPIAETAVRTPPIQQVEGNMVRVRAPATIASKNGLKSWYKRVTGANVANVGDRPEVMIDKKKVKNLQAMGLLLDVNLEIIPDEQPKKEAAPVSPTPPPAAPEPKKDTAPEHVGKGTIEVPILSGGERKNLQEFMKRPKILAVFDESKQHVHDPKQIQNEEENVPTFLDLTGYTLEQAQLVPRETWFQFATNNPKMAGNLIGELFLERRKAQKNQTSKETAGTPIAPTAAPVTQTGGGKIKRLA